MPDNVYDAVRYSNNPYAQTHPERLATVAILHGLTPPDPFARARARDRLRCGRQPDGDGGGDAGHPRAGRRPGGGADRRGPAAIAEIGLGNIELRQGDLRDLVDGSLGEFDYVVAHGVYSWIPADARDALMATIRASLAPAGVAYVSFNAHPGGYFRRMLRDVGLWHARAHDDGRPGRASRQGAGALQVPRRAPHDERRHLRRAARARGPGAGRRRRSTGSSTTTSPTTGIRSGSPSSPSTPAGTSWSTSARPTCTACAARTCPTASSPSCGSSPAATGSRSRTTPTC